MSKQSAIENLEMKIAFLEDTLEKLSEEFYQQQTEVSLLKGQQIKLIEKIHALNDANGGEMPIGDERPPHY